MIENSLSRLNYYKQLNSNGKWKVSKLFYFFLSVPYVLRSGLISPDVVFLYSIIKSHRKRLSIVILCFEVPKDYLLNQSCSLITISPQNSKPSYMTKVKRLADSAKHFLRKVSKEIIENLNTCCFSLKSYQSIS